MTRTRLGAVALAAAGVLFALYQAVRPYHDESTVAGATEAMSAGAWVASHTSAMIAFILVPLGLLALRNTVAGTRVERLAFTGAMFSWVGAGLTLPYYGAETFGLHAIADQAAEGQVLDLVDAVRFDPTAITMFIVGLLALGVGAVLAAIAVWRSASLPRYSGVVFALGFALLIPQFFTAGPVRIGHGLLVAAGSVWLAIALWRH